MQLMVLPPLLPTWNRGVMPAAKATILRQGDHKHYFKDKGMEKTLTQPSHCTNSEPPPLGFCCCYVKNNNVLLKPS